MTPLRLLIILISIFVVITISVIIYVSDVVSSGLPSLEQLENPRQNMATQVIGSDGELLDHFFIQKRVNLRIDEIPKDFKNGLISVEDRAFYDHWGVHTKRFITAMIKNILAMRIVEGGSTITMQLARNLFLDHSNSIRRKIREMFVAYEIEKNYSKDEILELYTNTVNFGRGAYGFQTAAKTYFDKSPDELTTAECAFLVGILKTPERYNGRNMELALYRRNLVLSLMYDQGVITSDEYDKSVKEEINIKTGNSNSNVIGIAPHFVEMIRQELNKKDNGILKARYDLYRDGLVIYTTLNTKIQKYAEEACKEYLANFSKIFNRNWNWKYKAKTLDTLLNIAIKSKPEYKAASKSEKKAILNRLKKNRKYVDSVKTVLTTIQTGLVVIDPKTGAILAMVGASPEFMEKYPEAKYSLNHATQMKRQPGSAFKPLVYSLSLEAGLTPDSTIGSGPYNYELVTGDIWSPGGSRDSAGTMVTLKEGLRRSINSVAARLVTEVTNPSAVVSLARRMGIKSKLMAVPAIALGAGGEVTPLELTSAYGTFDYDGYHVEPYYIEKIEDKYGNVLYQKNERKNIRDAMKTETAHTMVTMMQNVISNGTAYRIKKYFPGVDCAGKTGTTNDYKDAWFIGFTPQLVAGLWVGFDSQRIKFGPYGEGGKAAAPIWGILMNKIYSDKTLPFNKKEFDFLKPDSLMTDDAKNPANDNAANRVFNQNTVRKSRNVNNNS